MLALPLGLRNEYLFFFLMNFDKSLINVFLYQYKGR